MIKCRTSTGVGLWPLVPDWFHLIEFPFIFLSVYCSLYVANAGDCRAVLGRRAAAADGSPEDENVLLMEAVALSNDHNTREPVEQAKLRRLHPDEVSQLLNG